MKTLEEPNKAEHVILGQLKHKFTGDNMKIAIDSVENKGEKLDFMLSVPGTWTVSKKRLQYTDSLGVKRTIVPQERVEKFLQVVYENPSAPKGQASFANWIADRYIGVSQLKARRFIASKAPLQLMRNLQHKPTKNQRIVRGRRPFSKISADLGDLVSVTKKPNDSDGRYFLVVCCDFSGFIYAERLDGKSGKDVAAKLKKIFKKINKTATIGTLNSDMGTDFRNPQVKALCKKYSVTHIRPKVARIAPTAENAVRRLKRMIVLNCRILGKSFWWEVLSHSVSALNNIRREEGFTSAQVVRAYRERGKESNLVKKFSGNRRTSEKEDMRGHLPKILKGDYCRLRIPPDKLPPGFKSHLGFKDIDQTASNSWSLKIYRIEKIKTMRVNNKERFLLDNAQWRDRYELLLIPPDTVNQARREKEKLPMLKKKPQHAPPLPKIERNRRRKRVDYSKFF